MEKFYAVLAIIGGFLMAASFVAKKDGSADKRFRPKTKLFLIGAALVIISIVLS